MRGIRGCYPYDIPLPDYGSSGGWISGMAQGEAISVLLRAELEMPNQGFGDAALEAANPFRYPLAEGGVVWRATTHDVFFEEVALNPPSHTLNGHLYALWGLWELNKCKTQMWLSRLIEDARSTLHRHLTMFDSGYWSYYDLLVTPQGYRRVAIPYYHALHIAQLRVTSQMIDDVYMNEVADRWEGYTHKLLSRTQVIRNTLQGIFLRYLMRSRGIRFGDRSVLPD
jgi:hypothetical protein